MAAPTLVDVADWLSTPVADFDAVSAQMAIASVYAVLSTTHDRLPATDEAWLDPVNANARLGVVMTIARLRKRKDSPAGKISFDGYSATPAHYDGDAAWLLGPYETRGFG